MVVDTSALLAILFKEAEEALFTQVLARQEYAFISAVNVHECLIVLRIRQGPDALPQLWQLLETHSIEIVTFDTRQLHAAAEAFALFGKGLEPRARLNLCDCVAYALAKTMSMPLLFKGNDFAATDLVPAV